jgi:copper homeostasis protein (lipoprotein)
MRKIGSGVVLALVLVVACAKPPGPSDEAASISEALVGPRWRLIELEGQPSLGGGSREPHLIFSRPDGVNRVGGATGCNIFGGRYEAQAPRIAISELYSTRAACAEENRMRQEARYLSALDRADRYAVNGDTLTLSEGETVVARFVKEQ